MAWRERVIRPVKQAPTVTGRADGREPVLDPDAALTNHALVRLVDPDREARPETQDAGLPPSLRARLRSGEPGDASEQQADRAARAVVGPMPPAGTDPVPGRDPGDGAGSAGVRDALRSPGQPLEPGRRETMEQAFDQDLGGVRVHSSAGDQKSAQALGADAYTVGHDIVLGPTAVGTGSYASWVLAHELAHVVQQSGRDPAAPQFQNGPGGSGPAPSPEPLENIANRVAQLVLGPAQNAPGQNFFRGPVVSVVRDNVSGRIFVGLNTGRPGQMTEAVRQGIADQVRRLIGGLVVVQTGDDALGGHAEVVAVNSAVRARESATNRQVQETDLKTFELHNVWLRGSQQLEPAARCGHCARITRSISVTEGLFRAEGGVAGTVAAPQRGSVTAGGVTTGATTASGTIDSSRGSVVRGGTTSTGNTASGTITTGRPGRGGGGGGGVGGAGGIPVGSVVFPLAGALFALAVPQIKAYFAEHYLAEKWAAETQKMIFQAITDSTYLYHLHLMQHYAELQQIVGAGQRLKLVVEVQTDWVETDFGWAATKAYVVLVDMISEHENYTSMWPVFQPKHGFWAAFFHAPRRKVRRDAFEFVMDRYGFDGVGSSRLVVADHR